MKLSEPTINILKNFSEVSNSMVFREGKTQTIMTPTRSLVVVAEIDEELPVEFGIFNMSQFLSLVSVFNNAEIEFGDNYLTLTEGSSKAKYMFCDTSLIKSAPEKGMDIEFPEVDFAFNMKKELYSDLTKAARVLSVPHFVIDGDGSKISISVKNSENSLSDSFTKDVGETTENFSFILDIDTLKLMPHDYDVSISKMGIIRFASKEMKITYYVPIQA